MRLILTDSASADLAHIWHYIALDSIDAADRVIDDFQAAMRKLAEMPGMGHERSDVENKAYRFWRVHSYLLAYRVQEGTLYVSRIVHGSQNLRRLFRN